MITVVGLGFVGLTTALGFASKGFRVFGCDTDLEKISNLRRGAIPFHEPHLSQVLKEKLDETFFIENDLTKPLSESDVVFYCVGTPSNDDGSAVLDYLFEAISQTLKILEKIDFERKTLVIKSTVPPGTTTQELKPLVEGFCQRTQKPVFLTNNPEFLREGSAWQDFMNPDRIIVGAEKAAKVGKDIEKLYEKFDAPVWVVSPNTAEFIKYLSNCLLSTLISFSNEMSMLAKCIGDIEIKKSFEILHQDKRWSGNPANMSTYAYPGCGFGGYCLPKDIQALISQGKKFDYKAELLSAVIKTNTRIKEQVINEIIGNTTEVDTIGILGLSFKPCSDDIRNSPSADIIQGLLSKGRNKIVAYDPIANKVFNNHYSFNINYANSIEEIKNRCDIIALLTGWPEFAEKRLFEGTQILDFRYILDSTSSNGRSFLPAKILTNTNSIRV